jgi:hypothetical protein
MRAEGDRMGRIEPRVEGARSMASALLSGPSRTAVVSGRRRAASALCNLSRILPAGGILEVASG